LDLYAKKSIFNRDYPFDFTKEFDGEVKEYGFKSKVPYRTEDFVVWGIDYKSFEHKNDIDRKFNNKGFFVTNSNTFEGFMSGKTILTESLRYDNYSTFDNKFTGKIGLKHLHEKIEGLTTSMNYGTAYNVPTLYQLYGAYGSATLTPETTKSFDISVSYKHFTLTYFNNKITDMIDFDMNTFTYGNIDGTSKFKGFEIQYQNEIFADTLLTLGYTNLDAKDEEGKVLGRRPDETLKVAIDYYGLERVHLGVDAEYVGERREYDFFGNFIAQTGKYTLVNLTADYDISKNLQLYGKVVNLTDKYYQTVEGYVTSPRAFYLGLKADF